MKHTVQHSMNDACITIFVPFRADAELRDLFDKMDTNDDNLVTECEIAIRDPMPPHGYNTSSLRSAFEASDTNNDNFISFPELENVRDNEPDYATYESLEPFHDLVNNYVFSERCGVVLNCN